jgi:hypothetical protein
MKKIEDNLNEKGTFNENPSLIQANEEFNIVREQIELPGFTSSNCKRRGEQLNWRYVVDELRKIKR